MKPVEWTNGAPLRRIMGRKIRRAGLWSGLLLAPVLGGCINVKAPDKPIVIELNVNIRQEVVYRLAQDAENTIANNPEIF